MTFNIENCKFPHIGTKIRNTNKDEMDRSGIAKEGKGGTLLQVPCFDGVPLSTSQWQAQDKKYKH